MVLVDPDEQFTIHADDMFTMAKGVAKVFEGRKVYGKIKRHSYEDKLFDEGK